ncbi:MAG: class I SAM-dependent methyltransferase [Chloroflexi bacterium]|nr:class I SAM-dependent methyltransferase [Chloroflexota bacterium]
MDYHRNHQSRQLFDGIAAQYDWVPGLFSFFQYQRWRRYLVSRLQAGPDATVLDLCTGTAGVAMQTARTHRCRVVGVDLSHKMLSRAQRNLASNGLAGQVPLVMGRAEDLAFADDCFDAVCVTFLLRYVDDPESTMLEIIRVLKPGGRLVSLEFGVPPNPVARALWHVYTRGVLPMAGALVSRGWRNVGGFLGPSISHLYQSYTADGLRELWLRLGMLDVQVKRLSLGGGVVMWGTKNGSIETVGTIGR